ncbi:hypothetical protein NDU88_003101 [Pleurodeles waltl]|uniref:Uncharacterized protein n=1 Tax=Pleurodeles waltl TaxID=8319 RepID=A0AAV7RBX7_PLEWA|nr:hypothetical protein NDU88_003101 [Pleurodeles waltl]
MYVPYLDGSGLVAAETPFDINERLTVLQELQQFCDDKSSTSAATLGIRDLAKTLTGWIPKVGDLVREKIAVNKEFGPSYRAPVPVLGIQATQSNGAIPTTQLCRERMVWIFDASLLVELERDWSLSFKPLLWCVQPVFRCVWCLFENLPMVCLAVAPASPVDQEQLMSPMRVHSRSCPLRLRLRWGHL